MPYVDIYIEGFPCQPFSSLGLRGGMDDDRSLLFASVLSYIAHRPSVFMLENVRGLMTIGGGTVFADILKQLRTVAEGLYEVQHILPNAEQYGCRQHRPRIYIIGRRRPDIRTSYEWPPPQANVPLTRLLDP